jgi:hypothetical protein
MQRALLAASIGLPLLGFVITATDQMLVHLPGALITATNGNSEYSLHTWWSIVQLALAAGLAGWLGVAVRVRDQRLGRGLFLLAMVLLAMSLDELMQVHEYLAERLDDGGLALGGLPTWSLWVIPTVSVFVLFVAGLATQLRHLPADVGGPLLVAAALLVGSAGGLEVLSGAMESWALLPWAFEAEVFLEEAGEAVAASIAIVALLRLRQRFGVPVPAALPRPAGTTAP